MTRKHMYDFATNSVRAQGIRRTHKIGKCHAMIARGGAAVRPAGYSCKKSLWICAMAPLPTDYYNPRIEGLNNHEAEL